MSDPCPCGGAGSPSEYEACCGRFIEGTALPTTARELMRSRYSAYGKCAVDYLLATTAETQRAKLDRAGLEQYCNSLTLLRLKIIAHDKGEADDETGVVRFRATLAIGGRKLVQEERSRFARENGRWVFVDS